MPSHKSQKPAQSAAKPASKPAAKSTPTKPVAKVSAPTANPKPAKKVTTVPVSKSPLKTPAVDLKKANPATVDAEVIVKKKPGRPPKAASAASDAAPTAGAKRGRKPKSGSAPPSTDDMDMSDIEADLVGEPVVTGEKVKPLRMKISKAKERALMKEFGLDETVLSEEDIAKRRLRLKALIKLGKTRGYLTHGEISDHLPDKLVDAETLEVVISMLNDMGVAVYEQTPDAETLLLNNNVSTAATE